MFTIMTEDERAMRAAGNLTGALASYRQRKAEYAALIPVVRIELAPHFYLRRDYGLRFLDVTVNGDGGYTVAKQTVETFDTIRNVARHPHKAQVGFMLDGMVGKEIIPARFVI